MTREVEAIGLKLLNGAWSLNGLVDYTPALAGEWQEVPGNGAYVAHRSGLWSSPDTPVEPRYVVMECRDEVTLRRLAGVHCWRYVRLLREATADDVIPLARQEPKMALIHGSAHLANVIPADVWIELARREPLAFVNYAAKHLRDVPQHVWSELAQRSTITRSMTGE